MAFEFKKINPLDLDSSKAVGVKLPFNGPAVFNLTYTTKEALKTNLTNFFLTGVGERFMNPSFGSRFQSLLFSQITENLSQEIERSVREEIRIFFPQIRIIEVEVKALERINTVQFYLRYFVEDMGLEDTLLINLENPGY